jgi:triacylglycerol lipase
MSKRWVKWLVGGAVLAGLLPGLLMVAATEATLRGEPVSSAKVDDDAQTRYPIVLAHGMMGFGYIDKQSYWRNIPETLRAHGAQVFVTQSSSFNSSDLRGEQLMAQVRQIMRETGAKKVNLIGHSHGSQSVRYVAGNHPEWVASVTSVSGPTMGSEVADWTVQLDAEHPLLAGLILGAGNQIGALINWRSNNATLPIDAREAMLSLSSRGAAQFNQRFPAAVPSQWCGEGAHEVEGIRYYSWSSIGQFYRALNAADYLMALSGKAFDREKDANDGLVGKCSSHLGEVIRDDYPMNHFHTVNQLSGLVSPGADPVGLYLAHARRLKAAGL